MDKIYRLSLKKSRLKNNVYHTTIKMYKNHIIFDDEFLKKEKQNLRNEKMKRIL